MTNNENSESLAVGNAGDEHAGLSKRVFVLFVILGSQYSLAFITSPLIARFLGPTDRGRFTFFLSLAQWAVVILGMGAPQAITYLIASRRFSKQQSLSVVFTVLLTLGVATIIPCLLIFSLWSAVFTKLTTLEVAFVTAFSFAALSTVMLSALLLGLERSIDYYLSQLLTPLLFFIVLIALLLTGRFSYPALIESYTIIMIFSCIIVGAWVIKQVGFQFRPSLNFWRPILGYGLKIYPGSVLSMIIIRLDVFFVATFLGFTELGYYAISVQMAEVVYQLACVFATLRLPHTASRSKAEADRTFPIVSRQLILLSLLSTLIIAAGGITLIRIWLPAFAPSIVALLLLLPGTVSLGMANLYFAELGGRGRAGYGSMIIVINSVVMILLDLWLIPRWGINGAAIASSLVYTMGFSFALFAVQKESGIGFRELLLIGRGDLMIYKMLLGRAKLAIQALGSRT